ncbi:MAG: autotransporter-associated beta strand repeat-containing protein [Planctomycetales bacterium]|nr:autotransporter-associated beta strand repeat-containing protein [Planctomycetales bacterium]
MAQSSWIGISDGDWFDPLRWTEGVPNGAGVTAVVPGSVSSLDFTMDLTAPVELGQLAVGHSGDVTLGGTGPLTFARLEPGANRVELQSRGDLLVQVPAQVLEGQALSLHVESSLATLAFQDSLLGSGHLVKSGAGAVSLSGAGSSWNGSIELQRGRFHITDSAALGDANAETTVHSGAILAIEALTRDPFGVPEAMVFSGGRLLFESRFEGSTPTFSGQWMLTEDSVVAVSPLTNHVDIYNTIDGPGGLTFEVDGESRNAKQIRINGNNSYSGTTRINMGDAQLWIESPTALGDTSGRTIIESGRVTMYSNTAEEFTVKRGGFLAVGTSSPFDQEIILAGGDLSAVSSPGYFDGHIIVDGLGRLGGYADGLLVTRGTIDGTGSLIVGNVGDVRIEGTLDVAGDVWVQTREHAYFDNAIRNAGRFLVGRDLSLAANAHWSSPQSDFDGVVELRNGSLFVEADSRANVVVLDSRAGHYVPSQQKANLIVVDDATLQITEELRLRAGSISGNVVGVGDLRKTTTGRGQVANLGPFAGDIYVQAGVIQVLDNDGLGSTVGATYVARESILDLKAGLEIDDDVYLDNTRGQSFTGGLVAAGATLHGGLFLGDGVNYVGGRSEGLNGSADLTLAGVIHGGSLAKGVGFSSLRIVSDGHTYTGSTEVMEGALVLSHAGSLPSSTEIQLRDVFRPTLVMDNQDQTHPDRVPDNVMISSRGGSLEMVGGQQAVTEVIGTFALREGNNRVRAVSTGGMPTELQINSLQRSPGASLYVSTGDVMSHVSLPAVVTNDGLIGTWAFYHDVNNVSATDYATIDSLGNVVPYDVLHDYHADAATALPTDNLQVTETTTLPASTHVNVLRASGFNGSINLDGSTLAVEAGGLLSVSGNVTLVNGRVVPGAESGGELALGVFGGRLEVSTSIEDEASRSTLLHATGVGSLYLTGANTYSGTTTFADSLEVFIQDNASLPVNTDLTVSAARLTLDGDPVVPLGHVVVTNRGTIQGRTRGIQPATMELRQGTVDVPLVGTGEVLKTSEGTVELATPNPLFGGRIIVEEGILDVRSPNGLGGGAAVESQATIVRSGGILDIQGPVLEELLILEGGTLRGRSSTWRSPIDVRAPSRVEVLEGDFGITGDLVGAGDLDIQFPIGSTSFFVPAFILDADLNGYGGNLTLSGGKFRALGSNQGYTGNFTIDSIEVEVVEPNALGSGEVTVHEGGKVLAGGAVHANFVLTEGTLASGMSSATYTGTVHVQTDSYVGSPDHNSTVTFTGPLTLEPGVRLQNIAEGPIVFRGDIILRGDATIASFGNDASYTGALVAEADATLAWLGRANGFRGSVELHDDHALRVMDGSLPASLLIAGNANSLSGKGRLENDVQIGNSARLSPGPLIGDLQVIGDLSIAPGAVYEWDLLDATGNAGTGWDVVRVDSLTFAASSAGPFEVELYPVTDQGLEGRVQSFDASLDYTWPVITSSGIIGLTEDQLFLDASRFVDAHPDSRFGTFALRNVGSDLVVQYDPISGPPDFTGDHRVDDHDIDLLYAHLDGDDLGFDLDGDGYVSHTDVVALVTSLMGTMFGDANLDWRVDEQDFDIWRMHAFGGETGWAAGDFTGDGITDVSDFNVWLKYRGFNAAGAAVPEPDATMWLSLSWLALSWRRRPARQRS